MPRGPAGPHSTRPIRGPFRIRIRRSRSLPCLTSALFAAPPATGARRSAAAVAGPAGRGLGFRPAELLLQAVEPIAHLTSAIQLIAELPPVIGATAVQRIGDRLEGAGELLLALRRRRRRAGGLTFRAGLRGAARRPGAIAQLLRGLAHPGTRLLSLKLPRRLAKRRAFGAGRVTLGVARALPAAGRSDRRACPSPPPAV